VGALDPFGAEFGVAHWVRRAREHFGLPADRLCAALFDEVAAFQSGAAQADDMTLLVVRALTLDELGRG
jgi:serine phosphatase RsbU (regulator of sigma subunit)